MKKILVEKMMLEALIMAKKGLNQTLPNPRVGAVIFDNQGNVLGRGYHKRFAFPHAELEAINDALSKGNDLRGSNICVTLEPCNHHGKTPPCTTAILEAGIKTVYVGVKDDCPSVCGCGVEYLRSNGINVESGILEGECRGLNPGFNKFNSTGLPFVHVKSAVSMNGKINNESLENDKDKWFTSEEARIYVHELRSLSDLLITGLGTIKADNPNFNVRLNQKDDDTLMLPSNLAILDPKLELIKDYSSGRLNVSKAGNRIFIVCGKDIDKKANLNIEVLKTQNINLIRTDLDKYGMIDLDILLKKLASEYAFREILVEAGAKLTSSFLRLTQGYLDKFTLFIAPVWFNKESKSLFEFDHDNGKNQFPAMKLDKTMQFGDTVCLEMLPKY